MDKDKEFVYTADFVNALYRGILKRNPDPIGLDHNIKMLSTRALDEVQLIESFLQSEEYQLLQASANHPQFLSELEKLSPKDLYATIFGGVKPFKQKPSRVGIGSALCNQIHFSLDEYRFWMAALHLDVSLHRKFWELFYIAQGLYERDLLTFGKTGLVFAVGQEPLPALFASFGCEITATDQAGESAGIWAQTGQHAATLADLSRPEICPPKIFSRQVQYQNLDMNNITDEFFGQFDFCWSTCAYEHLGSLERGMCFVENSLKTLKPGGTAIHTTEFNVSSNDTTIESENLSIFRRRDIEELISRLERSGHKVDPIDWDLGPGFIENLVDLPPYKSNPHLRLRIGAYDCTSIGLIITKG